MIWNPYLALCRVIRDVRRARGHVVGGAIPRKEDDQ